MAEQNTNESSGLSDTERLVQEAMAEAEAASDSNEGMLDALSTTAVAGDESQRDGDDDASNMDLLGDVELHVTVELGRTQMLVEDVLRLAEGSVVELDKLAGDPVDVYVNNRLIARGEVLVLNDNFCIRISEIVADLEEQAEAARQESETQQT